MIGKCSDRHTSDRCSLRGKFIEFNKFLLFEELALFYQKLANHQNTRAGCFPSLIFDLMLCIHKR